MASNYPDWVLKYKKKGTYINKVKDKYYLYAAHSVRIKGTNKVRRISDGYLGKITEADGLIPPKNKSVSSLRSFELGISYVTILFTDEILVGLCHSFPKNGRLIYVCSVLNFIYNIYSQSLFEESYLHFHFPDVRFPASFPLNQVTAIERGSRMIKDRLSSKFNDELPSALASFSNVRLLDIDGILYCSGLSAQALDFSNKYEIKWENTLWQK